jgi:ABC-type multidrug transport system ATPase subunit
VGGIDALEHPQLARSLVGYFPQRLALYPNLTVEETLHFFALARGLPAEAVDEAMLAFGLHDVRAKRVGNLSGGTQQRVGLAQTFMGNPDLLVLDEPTSSLDPMVAGELKHHLLTLRKSGKSVLLASHVLSEVQELADTVGIMLKGKLVAQGSIAELGSKFHLTSRIHLILDHPSEEAVEAARRLGAIRAQLTDHSLIAEVDPSQKLSFLTSMVKEGIAVVDFHTQDPSLEEVFLRYVAEGG